MELVRTDKQAVAAEINAATGQTGNNDSQGNKGNHSFHVHSIYTFLLSGLS